MNTRATIPNANSDRWEYIKHLWIEEFRPLWFAPGLLLGICLGFVVGWLAHSGAAEEISRFFEGALPEIMSIGLTVTLLYYFDQWRQDKREDKRLQEELLWQIRSRSNDVAISAIDRLRSKGWLHLLNGHHLTGLSVTGNFGTGLHWAGAGLQEIDLSGADMGRANLSGADMRTAILSGALMPYANLSSTLMSYANLSSAKMRHANLSGADIWEANLSGADLGDANLSGAELGYANLSSAYLEDANLSGAKMQRVNLTGAKMRRANLENARLWDAEFDENTRLPDGTLWTPQTDIARFTNPAHLNFWRSDKPSSPAYRKPKA